MQPLLPDLRTGDLIAVRVTPNASRERLALGQGPDGLALVRIWVTFVPEAGKANAAVLRLLAKLLGVPKSRLSIEKGATGRDKLVRYAG